MRRNSKDLPNRLKLVRIFLVPLLVVVLLTKFEDKEWMGADVLTVIRHSWVDLSPVRAALSHLGEARGTPLREMLKR